MSDEWTPREAIGYWVLARKENNKEIINRKIEIL